MYGRISKSESQRASITLSGIYNHPLSGNNYIRVVTEIKATIASDIQSEVFQVVSVRRETQFQGRNAL